MGFQVMPAELSTASKKNFGLLHNPNFHRVTGLYIKSLIIRQSPVNTPNSPPGSNVKSRSFISAISLKDTDHVHSRMNDLAGRGFGGPATRLGLGRGFGFEGIGEGVGGFGQHEGAEGVFE